MSYIKQKNALLRSLDPEAIALLKSTNAIIAGGAITSIFSETEINDYDIYFRKQEDLVAFIVNAYNAEKYSTGLNFEDMTPFTLVCTHKTDRSITFNDRHNDSTLQLIHYAFHETPESIFEGYDFVHNMGAYDFSTEEFVLHPDFLTTLAARRLVFNAGTTYPIMSSLRVSKYVNRGYTISRKEMFKIAVAISALNIESWDELEEQLSGFYGVDVSLIFDKKADFSLDSAIEMLDKVEELPSIANNDLSPAIEDLLFSINGTELNQQRIFFKLVSPGTIGEYHSAQGANEVWVLDEVKYREVLVDHEYKRFESRYYNNLGYKIAVLQLVDGAVQVKHGSVHLLGNVKVLAFKDIEF